MNSDLFQRVGLFPRKIQLEDLETLLKIERQATANGWTLQNFKDSLSFKHNRCWLISSSDDDQDIIGYLIAQQILDEFSILNICIRPIDQGKGWGKLLLQGSIEMASDKGCSVIYLEVRSSNKAARKLYRKQGFRETGKRKGYYPSVQGREDAHLLSLLLE